MNRRPTESPIEIRTGLFAEFFSLAVRLGLLAILATAPFAILRGELEAEETKEPDAEEVADSTQPMLGWKNGDRLHGEILKGNGEVITWKADSFRDPFSIRQEHLQEIKFPQLKKDSKKEDKPPANHFRFVLRNGDRIFGDLMSITASTVVLKSDRFPENITLSRSEIDRIEQVRGNRMRFAGPVDLDEWKTQGRNRKVDEWDTGLRGEFMTYQWHADIFRPIDFPNSERSISLSKLRGVFPILKCLSFKKVRMVPASRPGGNRSFSPTEQILLPSCRWIRNRTRCNCESSGIRALGN